MLKIAKLLPPNYLEDLKLKRLPKDSEIVRRICQESFLAFCCAIKPPNEPRWLPTKFHSYLANELQRFYESVKAGTDERMIVEVQPQIGKSWLTSDLFPAWILGKEAWPIGVASYGTSLAEVKSQDCRNIVESEAYRMIFPKVKLDPMSTAKDYWRTSIGGSYRAPGVGSGLTGMPLKILIGDDLLKDSADAESVTVREGTHAWFKKVFYTRKQSKSGMIVINTRWHLDDVTGRLENEQRYHEQAGTPTKLYDHWKRFCFPAFAETDEYLDGKLFRKQGEVLCSERFTKQDMEKTRNGMDVADWSALYMQNPVLAENAEFKKEWFRYYDDSEIKLKEIHWVTLVDPAISKAQTADNSVVRSIGFERSTGYWYLGEETAGKMDAEQLIEAIFHHNRLYKSQVWVESVAYQAAIPQFVMAKQRRDKQFFNVDELKHSKGKSKEARIRGLVAHYKAGMIFHRRSDKDLETELLQWPKGRHDDRCLIGETLIATEFGDKKIKDIKVGDRVLTPLGLSKVLASECTAIVGTFKHLGLEGTADHKVFTWNGFQDLTSIDTLTILDTLTIKNQVLWLFRKLWSSMVLHMPLWGRKDIISVLPQLTKEGKEPKGFMWLFGSFIQEKLFLRLLLSIIKMVIPLIITLKTWFVYRVSNMLRNISNFLKHRQDWPILIGSGTLLKNGINLLKVEPGTPYIANNNGLISRKYWPFVFNVVNPIKPISQRGQSFALSTFADKSTGELKKVYNLKTANGIYYANGILVSNCDALAFGLEVEVPPMPSETPKERQRREKEEKVTFDPFKSIQQI